jgi:hypothetical protein
MPKRNFPLNLRGWLDRPRSLVRRASFPLQGALPAPSGQKSGCGGFGRATPGAASSFHCARMVYRILGPYSYLTQRASPLDDDVWLQFQPHPWHWPWSDQIVAISSIVQAYICEHLSHLGLARCSVAKQRFAALFDQTLISLPTSVHIVVERHE